MANKVVKYRKKPIVIEAIQWEGTKDSYRSVCSFVGEDLIFTCGIHIEPQEIYINTYEGTMMASKGDFIIKGINGEFYPCKPDIFESTYDLVE